MTNKDANYPALALKNFALRAPSKKERYVPQHVRCGIAVSEESSIGPTTQGIIFCFTVNQNYYLAYQMSS